MVDGAVTWCTTPQIFLNGTLHAPQSKFARTVYIVLGSKCVRDIAMKYGEKQTLSYLHEIFLTNMLLNLSIRIFEKNTL